MKLSNKRTLLIISAIAAFFPGIVFAQTLSFASQKTSYTVGDSFAVNVFLNTSGKQINTISGTVLVSPTKFQITDVRYGNSIISLWVTKPTIDSAAGTITFTGGVPGGYSGSNGPLFSFVLKAAKVGSASVSFAEDIKVLLNDGEGTEVKGVVLRSLALSIAAPPKVKPFAPPPPPAIVYVPPPDTIPPEPFIPLVSRHPTVADNKYFVSFSAVDKDSGINYYEVREEPWLISYFTDKFNTDWTRSQSPYILKYQLWTSKVLVRAYDRSLNSTVAYAIKPMDAFLSWIFAALIGLAVVIISRLVPPRQRKSKRRSSQQ